VKRMKYRSGQIWKMSLSITLYSRKSKLKNRKNKTTTTTTKTNKTNKQTNKHCDKQTGKDNVIHLQSGNQIACSYPKVIDATLNSLTFIQRLEPWTPLR